MQRPTHSPLEQARHLQSVARRLDRVDDLQAEIGVVLAEMDRGYTEIALHYDFSCHGCEESCCRTLFYHHTYAEFLMLFQGLEALTGSVIEALYGRAADTQATLAAAQTDVSAEPPRAMCPLNMAGRCTLYAYRPMICRLHGIPHELRRPDGHVISGPGCHLFDTLDGRAPSPRLDRTPFYQNLARVEQHLRRHIEAPIRLHMTLAECLSAFAHLGSALPGKD